MRLPAIFSFYLPGLAVRTRRSDSPFGLPVVQSAGIVSKSAEFPLNESAVNCVDHRLERSDLLGSDFAIQDTDARLASQPEERSCDSRIDIGYPYRFLMVAAGLSFVFKQSFWVNLQA